jgi:hypothetical protein
MTIHEKEKYIQKINSNPSNAPMKIEVDKIVKEKIDIKFPFYYETYSSHCYKIIQLMRLEKTGFIEAKIYTLEKGLKYDESLASSYYNSSFILNCLNKQEEMRIKFEIIRELNARCHSDKKIKKNLNHGWIDKFLGFFNKNTLDN